MLTIKTEQDEVHVEDWQINIPYKSTFQLLKDSIVGKKFDYTKIKIPQAILLLSLPMILEMFMETLFAIVDIAFVSQLGEDAVSAVGITESIMTIVYALAAGISVAVAAIVSRRVGQNNEGGAKMATVHSVVVGCIIAGITSIAGILFASSLLCFLEASPQVQDTGLLFLKITIGSNLVVMLLFIINAVFRSSGDPALAFKVLIIANLINIVLDSILIFGIGFIPGLGLLGAAIATLVGRSVGVALQLYYLFSGKSRIRLKLDDIDLNWRYGKKIMSLSLGGILQNLMANGSWVWLVRIISSYGSTVTAGYTIALRVVMFALLPSWGISNATSTLVGQNLGAGNSKRAESAIWYTSIYNLVFLGIIGLIITFFATEIMTLFIKDNAVIQNGTNGLKLLCYGFIVYGFGMVLIQALNGAGDTLTPTIIFFVSYWLVQIPLANILSENTGLGANSAYVAILTGETIMSVLGIIMIKLGYWKKVRI